MKCNFCKYYVASKSLLFGLGIQYEKCKINSFNLRRFDLSNEGCRKSKFSLISTILNKTLRKIPL